MLLELKIKDQEEVVKITTENNFNYTNRVSQLSNENEIAINNTEDNISLKDEIWEQLKNYYFKDIEKLTISSYGLSISASNLINMSYHVSATVKGIEENISIVY